MSAFASPLFGFLIDRVGLNVFFVFGACVLTLIGHGTFPICNVRVKLTQKRIQMEQLGRRRRYWVGGGADVRDESMTSSKDQYQIFRHLFEFGTIHHCGCRPTTQTLNLVHA